MYRDAVSLRRWDPQLRSSRLCQAPEYQRIAARRGTIESMTLPPAPQCYHRALAPVKNESSGQNSIPNELQQVAVGVADVMADAGGPTAVSAPDTLRRSFDHFCPRIG